jgi:hypothetical protein
MFEGTPRRKLILGAWFFGIIAAFFICFGLYATFSPETRYWDPQGNTVPLGQAVIAHSKADAAKPVILEPAPKPFVEWRALMMVCMVIALFGWLQLNIFRELRRQKRAS